MFKEDEEDEEDEEEEEEEEVYLRQRIFEHLNVDDGAVLAEILAQLLGRRLPAEPADKELVVRQVGRRGAARRAALVQRQAAQKRTGIALHPAGCRSAAAGVHACRSTRRVESNRVQDYTQTNDTQKQIPNK